jgi:hypothetical protein
MGRMKRAFLGWTVLCVLANAVFLVDVFLMCESHRGVALAKLLSLGGKGRSEGYTALHVFMSL